MKNIYKILLISVLLVSPAAINAQVLISLIFGEALNTEEIEFGLIGGMNRSYINDISDSKGMNNFDLGFYFHILIKNSSYVSTGVMVKSNVGATGMDVYPIGEASFDTVFQNGTLTKKINCFYVPIMFHQRFNNRWYIEAGTQLGLIFKPVDIFTESESGGDLKYTLDVRDDYKSIDAGLIVGAGYKFKKETKSLSAGIKYYYGLVNVSSVPDLTIKNSAISFYIKIPIGVKEKEK
ncbi:MAG: PorT family protein [Bacteroidia bacterium]|nr:MAG: PorT family protein [Bacteroidia bacterium]